MRLMPSTLKNTLTIALFALSFVTLAEYYYGRLHISSDQAKQYVAARQLSIGNGLTRPVFNADDLSQPGKMIHTEWPPGLSVVAAGLMRVTKNVFHVHSILSIMVLGLFLLAFYRLLNDLLLTKIELWQHALLFLFLTINGMFLIAAAHIHTDIICLSLFMLAAHFLITYYNKGKKIKYLWFSAALLATSVYFRYAYFPVLVALPAFFLWRTLIGKTGEFKEVLISGGMMALTAAPFLLHIFIINSQTSYVAEIGSRRGEAIMDVGRFIRTNPFAMNAFFDQFPIIKLLGYTSEVGYDRGYDYPQYIQWLFKLISLALLVPVGLYYYYNLKTQNHQNHRIFILLAVLSSIGLIIIVWGSFILRYFLVPILIVQLTYILMALNDSHKKLRYIALMVLTMSFIYSITLKTYNYTFNYKPFRFEHNTALLRPNESLLNAYHILRELPVNPAREAVLIIDKTAEEKLFRPSYFFTINNLPTSVQHVGAETKLGTSRETKVFFITTNHLSPNTDAFMAKHNAAQTFETKNNLAVYHFTLAP